MHPDTWHLSRLSSFPTIRRILDYNTLIYRYAQLLRCKEKCIRCRLWILHFISTCHDIEIFHQIQRFQCLCDYRFRRRRGHGQAIPRIFQTMEHLPYSRHLRESVSCNNFIFLLFHNLIHYFQTFKCDSIIFFDQIHEMKSCRSNAWFIHLIIQVNSISLFKNFYPALVMKRFCIDQNPIHIKNYCFYHSYIPTFYKRSTLMWSLRSNQMAMPSRSRCFQSFLSKPTQIRFSK